MTRMNLRCAPLAGAALWFCLCLGAASAAAAPAEVPLRAQLIWGTDDPKPKDADFKELKDLDIKLKKRLSSVFKWKSYFEISAQKLVVPPRGVKRVKMSPKCELEFRMTDEATLEVKLFGEGKLTKTIRQSTKSLEQGEIAVLAGDDKDKYGDAWFVVISEDKPEKGDKQEKR